MLTAWKPRTTESRSPAFDEAAKNPWSEMITQRPSATANVAPSFPVRWCQ